MFHRARFQRLGSKRSERGVALLIVVTILVTMVIVAVPFALSMRQGQERTQAVAARGRATFEASLLAEFAKQFLARTHPDNEQLRFDRGDRTVDALPGVDSLDEITPNDAFRKKLEEQILSQWDKDPRMAARAEYLRSRGLGPMNDDRGSIWSVSIQDAQALVNVNGVSPFLLANLMGSALLSDDMDTGGGDIAVEHVVTGRFGGLRGFPPEGGLVRVGREVIRYEEFDGTVFRGCERAVLQESPLGDNGGAGAHKKGTPVIDYTAYKLATHLIARRPGGLTPFTSLEALRDIASWGEDGVISAERLERLLPYLTVWSRRESPSTWLADQLVMNELPMSVDGAEPEEILLRNIRDNPAGTTAFINPGTILRITDGLQTVYQSVSGVGDDDGRQRGNFVTVAGPVTAAVEDVTFKGGETTVAAYAPYPININTASRAVLYAVMANVQFYRSEGKEQIVTPELAWELAGDIQRTRKDALRADSETGRRVSGPFRTAQDFGQWLESKVRSSEITRTQQAALYTNAINPHSWMLRFGTAPWCFRTLDVYHVEARVALNNRAGEQIAEAGVREVVEIGSDTTASWVLDSQQEFEQRIAMGSGAKWVTTYPFGVAFKSGGSQHIQPALRAPKGYVNNVYPSTARGEDLGDVRLEPARLLLENAQLVEHFDSSWYADGHYTGYDGAYITPVAGSLMGNSDKYVRPFTMSFWWRPYSDQNWTAFDAGIDQFENRFAVFVQDGELGQELTFRCCAGNRWQAGAEVYVPFDQLDYEPGNWYHIQVSCAGEDPATMQLLVDGVDIGKRRGMTLMSGSVTSENEEIPVDSTDGFPIRGAIRIGTEIIEYDTLAESSFRDCVRGARGTQAQEWPSTTPVHNAGYSMPITVDIMEGGRYLSETLDRWSAVRISTMMGGEKAPDTVTATLSNSPYPVILGGFGPERTTMDVTTVGIWGQDDNESADAFNSSGLALMGSPPASNIDADQQASDVQIGGWEVVYYTRSDTSFSIERFQETAWQDKAEPYFLVTEQVSVQMEWPAYLVPISVLAGGAGQTGADYLDPSIPEEEEILTRYYGTGDTSARVLIGTDAQDGPPHEIIRYDSIDRDRSSPSILFVRDRNIGSVVVGFFQSTRGLASNDPPPEDDDPLPPPDPPPGPVPPPDPDDGGGFEPPPGDPDEPKDPTPGDGVPPGQRDPTDPPTGEDPGDPDVPDPDVPDPDDGGGDAEPGDEDPTPSPGPGGGFEEEEGDGEDGEPLDPDDGEEDDGGGFGEPEGGETDEEGGGGATQPGDAVDPGGGSSDGESSGDQPPPEEPSEDESGGGGDFGSPDDGSEEGGDAVVPDSPAPEAREPSDPEEESDPDEEGDVLDPHRNWPEGIVYTYTEARQEIQFRGVNGLPNDLGGVRHLGQGSSADENSLFLPCFRVWEDSKGAPLQRCGRNDVITVTDGSADAVRIQIGVRWGDLTSDWCALDDFIDKRFEAEKDGAMTRRNDPRGHPRVMKFPCGELPDDMSKDIEFAQSSISGSDVVTAFLDELYIWRQGLDTQLVVKSNGETGGILEGDDEFRLVNVGTKQVLTTIDGFDTDCGVVLCEGELIIYRSSRTEGENTIILEDCARAQFGTRATYHPLGAPARFLPDMPVSFLEGGMTAEASTVPTARTRGWPREGLVRILREDTSELVHYTRRGEKELIMPVSIDADQRTRDRGLFRGRFGTDATDHDNGEILIYQPFRFWDRFTARRTEEMDSFSGVHDHPETSYFEVGKKVRSAYWRGFSWSENVLGRLSGTTGSRGDEGSNESSGYLDIYVLARFNANVPWDTDQVVDLRDEQGFGGKRDLGGKKNDHLFLFDDVGTLPIGQGKLGNSLGLESDAAEFRVYFVYKANAFEGVDQARVGGLAGELPILSNSWKQSPWLRAFTVNYYSRTITRHRATIR